MLDVASTSPVLILHLCIFAGIKFIPGSLLLKMNQISKIKSASKVQMSTTWVSLEHTGCWDLTVPFGGSGS